MNLTSTVFASTLLGNNEGRM